MKGNCNTCGQKFIGRNSKKHSAKYNFLRNVRKHYLKKHKASMVSKANHTRQKNRENPSIQDFVNGLMTSAKDAIITFRNTSERQYQDLKVVMDAIEPILPELVKARWHMVEAVHDGLKKW